MALFKSICKERDEKNDKEVVQLSINAGSSKSVRKRGDTNSYNEHEGFKIGQYAYENGNKKVQHKPLHAVWLISTFSELQARNELVAAGFQKAGIAEVVSVRSTTASTPPASTPPASDGAP